MRCAGAGHAAAAEQDSADEHQYAAPGELKGPDDGGQPYAPGEPGGQPYVPGEPGGGPAPGSMGAAVAAALAMGGEVGLALGLEQVGPAPWCRLIYIIFRVGQKILWPEIPKNIPTWKKAGLAGFRMEITVITTLQATLLLPED